MKVYDWMTAARMAKGITVAEMSQALGISPGALRNYESGIHRVPAETVVRVAAYTGATMDTMKDGIPSTQVYTVLQRLRRGRIEKAIKKSAGDMSKLQLELDALEFVEGSISETKNAC